MATFAPISIDTLESLRKQGMKDDAIAEQMAQSSPGFSSQLTKIRKKFAGDPAATTAYLNTRFYGVVDHAPDKPKGIVGRSLDRIYDNFQKDTQDIRTSLEQNAQGKQGFLDTTLQVAGNLGSIMASPVAQPVQEAVGTVAKGIYNNVPGVKPLLQEAGQSRLVQEGVLPAIRSTSTAISQASENNPSLRTLGSVGEGISDLADVYGGAQAAKYGAQGLVSAAKAIPQLPRIAGQALGTTARIGTQPIREGFSGFMQGVRGQTDDAARLAAQNIDDSTKELVGVAKEAVSKGVDEKLVRFAVQQTPETKRAMAAMTEAAKSGANKLGGDTVQKEILGQYVLGNMEHILGEKNVVGKALGAMKKGMADEVIDMTDDFVDLQNSLRNAGAVINEKGVITRLAAESDDNIPMLQEALNFLSPDDAGRVVKRFKDVDMWRSKMFKEMNSAKAKIQPSASGQSVFNFSENVVNKLRRSAIQRASVNNPRLLAYNDAFEDLSTQSSKFLKSIGYKGKLSIEDITAKDLRAGEVALRTLGNASADVRDSFESLIKTARKYGYTSQVDEMNLIRWADALEDIFPITPSRSLQGGVSRGTKDALGNMIEDTITGGARRGVLNVASEKLMGAIDKMRGMTVENRHKLLMDILNAPADTPLLRVIDDVFEDVPASVKSSLRGIDAGDVQDAIPPTQLPKALPRDGATAKKFPTLTPEEISALTPEEKATGILGGGDGVKVKSYPLEDIGKWYGDANYKSEGGTLRNMSPDDFLKRSKKLEVDDIARENIDNLKEHMQSGKKLDPLTLYSNDTKSVSASDGRHRAIAAKELGIKEVPVVDYTNPPLPPVGGTKPLSPLMVEARKYKSADEFVKAQGKPIYRGQLESGSNLQTNKGGGMSEIEGGKFFTTDKTLADKFGDNTVDRLSNTKNTVTKQETIKLQEMATKQVEKDMAMQVESNNVIEDMALGKPKAFAEYTGKPVVEVQHLLGRQNGEVLYYEQFDSSSAKTKSQLTDLWNQANQSK